MVFGASGRYSVQVAFGVSGIWCEWYLVQAVFDVILWSLVLVLLGASGIWCWWYLMLVILGACGCWC